MNCGGKKRITVFLITIIFWVEAISPRKSVQSVGLKNAQKVV